MDDSMEGNAAESEGPAGLAGRDELVSYLTSTGRIRRSLAESLYDGGLDSWNLLVEGDEEYFLGFKGVGKKTAGLLLEVGKERGEELKISAAARGPTVEDLLAGMKGTRKGLVGLLQEAGYNRASDLTNADPLELQKIKGIGLRLSETIISKAREELEREAEDVEEAKGEMETEEGEEGVGKEEGLLSRLLAKVKSLFGGPQSEVKPDEEGLESKDPEEKDEVKGTGGEEVKGSETGEEPEVFEEPDEAGGGREEIPSKDEVSEEPKEESQGEEGEGGKADEEAFPEEEEGEEEKPAGGFLKTILSRFRSREKESMEEKELESEPAPSEDDGEEKKPPEEDATTPEEPEKEPTDEEGEAKEEQIPGKIENFHQIPGISDGIADKLLEAGYMDLAELREAVPEDLMFIEGIDKEKAEHICKVIKRE